MNKYLFGILAVLLVSTPMQAQNSLQNALPLLQKKNRSVTENQRVFELFRSSKDLNTVFAAGASLVQNPPAKTLEPALFNMVMKGNNGVRETFAAVIITAMGSSYEELLPVLQDALESKDAALRSYAAGAYGILKPEDKTYTRELVRLYMYDENLANRAMNLVSSEPKHLLKYLKDASLSTDPATRAAAAAWLGSLHTDSAAKQLLKMAKTETHTQVQAQLATALAKNRDHTLDSVAKELRKDYNAPASATYALALGFMTGNAVDTLKKALASVNENERINATRAAAYMANVLSNPDAFTYSTDRRFDITLLKGLIPQLNVMAKTASPSAKVYAENALRQIEKLME